MRPETIRKKRLQDLVEAGFNRFRTKPPIARRVKNRRGQSFNREEVEILVHAVSMFEGIGILDRVLKKDTAAASFPPRSVKSLLSKVRKMRRSFGKEETP